MLGKEATHAGAEGRHGGVRRVKVEAEASGHASLWELEKPRWQSYAQEDSSKPHTLPLL